MRVIVIFFNEDRTDFLVVGPFEPERIDAALAIEKARFSNNEAVSFVDVPLMHGRDR